MSGEKRAEHLNKHLFMGHDVTVMEETGHTKFRSPSPSSKLTVQVGFFFPYKHHTCLFVTQ